MKRIVKTFNQYNKLNEHLGDTDDALIDDIIEILDAEELDFNYSPMFIDNFIADRALQDRDSDTIAAAITDWVKHVVHFDGGEDSSLDTPVVIVGCKEGNVTYVVFSNMHQVESPSMKQGFADSIETGSYDLIYIIDFMKSADDSGRFWSGSNRPTGAKGLELYYEDCEIIKVFSNDNLGERNVEIIS